MQRLRSESGGNLAALPVSLAAKTPKVLNHRGFRAAAGVMDVCGTPPDEEASNWRLGQTEKQKKEQCLRHATWLCKQVNGGEKITKKDRSVFCRFMCGEALRSGGQIGLVETGWVAA